MSETLFHNETIVDRNKLVALNAENAARGLTLATLCDMALGEDAEDRSDDALIRKVGRIITALENLFQACSNLPLEEMDRMMPEIMAASSALKVEKPE